jgi:hypothetical protein
MRRLFMISMLAVLTCIAPRLANAQESPSSEAAFSESRLEFVYEGPERSLTFLNAVANRIQPELPAGKKASQPIQMQVVTTPEQAELNDSIKLRTLLVYWPTELKLSNEEQSALVESARKKIEAELQRVQSLADNASDARKQAELDELCKKRDKVLREWNQTAGELSTMQRRYGLTTLSDVANQMAQADTRLRELQIQEAGISARRAAVDKRIDQLRTDAQVAAQQDSGIIKELEQLVQIRENQVKGAKALNQSARVGPDAVQEAEAALARARIDFLTAKKEATEAATGPVLRELNNELSRLVVQAAENSGQQKQVKELIQNLPGAGDQFNLTVLQRISAQLLQRLTEVSEKIHSRQTDEVAHPLTKLRPLADVESEQKKEEKK